MTCEYVVTRALPLFIVIRSDSARKSGRLSSFGEGFSCVSSIEGRRCEFVKPSSVPFISKRNNQPSETGLKLNHR